MGAGGPRGIKDAGACRKGRLVNKGGAYDTGHIPNKLFFKSGHESLSIKMKEKRAGKSPLHLEHKA